MMEQVHLHRSKELDVMVQMRLLHHRHGSSVCLVLLSAVCFSLRPSTEPPRARYPPGRASLHSRALQASSPDHTLVVVCATNGNFPNSG